MINRLSKIFTQATPRVLTTLALLTLALGGCGWQLRGAGMIPEDLKALHISARDPQGQLVRTLSRALHSAGVETPASAADSELSLVIVKERSLVRTASVNENARVSEQELTEDVEFMVVNRAGEQLLPLTTARVERVFEYDEDNVLATQDERELIRSEMRRDLVNQILNRLRQLGHTNDAPAS